MATYMVDSAQVSAAAARVGATSETIRQQVQAMLAELIALESSWSGAAQQNFQACVAGWQATQVQVEASLDAIGAQMNTAASVYADAEAQSTALFAS
ncbi:WXG100 family type VII secretion target [Actinomyces mediterranea]|uniref:WXG100 family type VII secretion target n=1 Tax=Actinomyces mediterranea TaxID=1871028 RepID=UPI000970D970|nr:WXG100 family type VII secretion target [Actinomyces mediterranea]